MNHELIRYSGTDEELIDDLQSLGYIPVSARTRIKNRIERMRSSLYTVASQIFQRLDFDFEGNRRASPVHYTTNRTYE